MEKIIKNFDKWSCETRVESKQAVKTALLPVVSNRGTHVTNELFTCHSYVKLIQRTEQKNVTCNTSLLFLCNVQHFPEVELIVFLYSFWKSSACLHTPPALSFHIALPLLRVLMKSCPNVGSSLSFVTFLSTVDLYVFPSTCSSLGTKPHSSSTDDHNCPHPHPLPVAYKCNCFILATCSAPRICRTSFQRVLHVMSLSRVPRVNIASWPLHLPSRRRNFSVHILCPGRLWGVVEQGSLLSWCRTPYING